MTVAAERIPVILIMELVLLERAFSENDVVPCFEPGDWVFFVYCLKSRTNPDQPIELQPVVSPNLLHEMTQLSQCVAVMK
jgi:hypothetical protein